MRKLEPSGIPCTLWIDGSMLTEEDEPSDMDFAVHISSATLDALTPEQQEVWRFVKDKLKHGEYIDLQPLVTFPEGHPNHDEGEWFRAWLHGHWGWDSEFTEKGIALVKLNGGLQ